jgi:hypothetical protein
MQPSVAVAAQAGGCAQTAKSPYKISQAVVGIPTLGMRLLRAPGTSSVGVVGAPLGSAYDPIRGWFTALNGNDTAMLRVCADQRETPKRIGVPHRG